MRYIIQDATRENEQRIRRAQLLKRSQKLNKNELWQGILISVITAFAIVVILFCWAFPALSYAIDNLSPAVWTVFTLITLSFIAWWMIRKTARG